MYGTKTKYARKYARKGRVAKLAKGRTTNIRALAKSVMGLKRQLRKQGQYQNYSYLIDKRDCNSDALVLNLNDYSNYIDSFGMSADDDQNNRIKHISGKLDMYFQMGTEHDNTQFTVFLVSLKDQIGSAFDTSNGVLSLTSGTHYTKVSTYSGLIQLNPKCFKVHKVKRFILGNNGQGASTATAERQSGKSDMRLYWKYRTGHTINNPYGSWKTLRNSLDPSQNQYLLIFNDNSVLDLEYPNVTINALFTMKTAM